MSSTIRKTGKITVVIPVRAGSVRCKHKNFRPFGDTTLLARKIKQIKLVKEVDEIIVSTSSEIMLNIARELGVKAIKRDEFFSRSETSSNELFGILAEIVETPIMIYTTCVSPFAKNEDLIKMIKMYREDTKYTSIVSAEKIKKHMWINEKPLNFALNTFPKSQDLPDVCAATFAFNIIETELARKEKTVFGKKPYFYFFNELNALDIDTPFEFVISELLYKNKIINEDDITDYLNRPKKFELLDYTIRDILKKIIKYITNIYILIK